MTNHVAITCSLACLLAMTACGSTPSPIAKDDGNGPTTPDAITIGTYPGGIIPIPIHPIPVCGIPGDKACTTGTPCEAGTIELGSICTSCTSIRTNFSVATQMVTDLGTDYQAVVHWTTSPAAPVQVVITNTNDPADFQTYDSGTSGSGSWMFPALEVGATYEVTVTPFGWSTTGQTAGQNFCSSASTTVTIAKQSVTWASGLLYPYSGDGYASITMSNDGNWTYSGHVHDSGAFALNYGFASHLNYTDTTGAQPLSWLATGTVDGTFNVGSRDSDFSQSGFSEGIALSWAQIATSQATFNLQLTANIGDAVINALEAVGIVTLGGSAAVLCTQGNNPTVGTYQDSNGGAGVEVTCSKSY